MLVSCSVNNLKEREQKICHHTFNKYSTSFRCVLHYSKDVFIRVHNNLSSNIRRIKSIFS